MCLCVKFLFSSFVFPFKGTFLMIHYVCIILNLKSNKFPLSIKIFFIRSNYFEFLNQKNIFVSKISFLIEFSYFPPFHNSNTFQSFLSSSTSPHDPHNHPPYFPHLSRHFTNFLTMKTYENFH